MFFAAQGRIAMCHFVTATLAPNTDLAAVAPIFESHKLGFKLIDNSHISVQVERGTFQILTTRGHCDCGTILGSLDGTDVTKPVNYEPEIKKFRQQGWSEAKIRRWIAQKAQTKEKEARKNEYRADGGASEAARWVALITDLLKSRGTGKVGLLVHMYSGGIEGERIKLLGKKTVSLKELNPELLMRMHEDELYEFVA